MGTERDRRQKRDSRTYSRTGKVAEDAATVLAIKETMSPGLKETMSPGLEETGEDALAPDQFLKADRLLRQRSCNKESAQPPPGAGRWCSLGTVEKCIAWK
jgi:hypothetical protein